VKGAEDPIVERVIGWLRKIGWTYWNNPELGRKVLKNKLSAWSNIPADQTAAIVDEALRRWKAEGVAPPSDRGHADSI
jgi:hypothetical protein